ncbi:hypothetical protein MH117_21525 [Paenibacillus sp. ACRRX]|uniref:hypothetical protein n=1 Tax=Paenibacillus sp. ACRRX TaxID=2918206 RepID=UPI001EF4BDA2|nr:hypothetical protein [Paenibacillus sp. ACRRX]MCG7409995.1 hypothetical protein [Paenibacillus sp. ACRRX]
MQHIYKWKKILRGFLAAGLMFVLLGCGQQTEEKLHEVQRLIADVQKEHSLDKAALKRVVIEGMEQYLQFTIPSEQLHLSYGLSKNLKPYGLNSQAAGDMVTIIGRVTPRSTTVGQGVNGIFAEIDCSTNKVYSLGVIGMDSLRHNGWKDQYSTSAEQKARWFITEHFQVKEESLVRIHRREWIRGRFMFWDKVENTRYVVAVDKTNRIVGFHSMQGNQQSIMMDKAPFL